jgi:hypothetical protein
MVDTAVYVLRTARGIYIELKTMRQEIVANKKAFDSLLSRIENVMPDVEEMVEAGLSNDSNLQPAQNFVKLCEDVRDWARPFCMRDYDTTNWIGRGFALATQVYNWKEDRRGLEEFLQRLDTCSQDLNLRITMDLKKSLESMRHAWKEDTDAMRKSMEEFSETVKKNDEAKKHEEQFHKS